jgi:hypothetical protein
VEFESNTHHCAAADGTAYWPHYSLYGQSPGQTPGADLNRCGHDDENQPRVGSETHGSDHPPVMAKFRIN